MVKTPVSIPYIPEWLTYEVSQALAALVGEHVAKMETTILRMAQAVANGASLNSVFEQNGTCTKRIWYGYTDAKTGKVKSAWRDDPAVVHALGMATERARWWVRVRHGQAVQNALDVLMDGAEVAAHQLTNLVRFGYVKFDYGPNGIDGSELRNGEVREVLAAAQDLLNRVSELTAGKGGVTHTLNSDQFAVLLKQAKVDAAVLEDEAITGWNDAEPTAPS